jgi:hypothetical protein
MWNYKVRTKQTVVLLALAGTLGWLPSHAGAQSGVATRARAAQAYSELPLRFEANAGQRGGQARFLSRGRGYTLFLTSSEAVLTLNKTALHMHLLGANANAEATGVDKLAGTVNYFLGNDPKKWRTNVPTYGKVEYRNVYSGVDLLYYGNQQQLEYDLVVAPGANPGVARLGIGGASKIQIDVSGDLVLQTLGGVVRLQKPVAYQRTPSGQQPIDARYALGGDGQVGFDVGSYDHSKPLVIDPVLVYSSFLAGSASDTGAFAGIAVDSAGSAYVIGSTNSTDFPTANPEQPSNRGGVSDVFVTKFKPDGSGFEYSTYLGGSLQDTAGGIAVDSSGNAYVTGQTDSADFPTTTGSFQPTKPSPGFNTAAFVTKLNASGSAISYSTYLGGSLTDWGQAIAVDSAGRASVTGEVNSKNFPVTLGAPQTTGNLGDAFVTTFTADGSSLVFSTYLGGRLGDEGTGIAVDPAGNVYVTGFTTSSNFPVVNALQPTNGGVGNAFVAKFNPNTAKLVYSTYLGGSGTDQGWAIAVDSSGSAYVTGYTESTDFPTVNPIQAALGGAVGVNIINQGVFVSKLNPAGSALVYSTYLGGGESVNGNADLGEGIAVDSTGAAYVTGYSQSGNFPAVNSLEPFIKGIDEVFPFVTKINPEGSALVYSTFLGFGQGFAIAVDTLGNAYATGATISSTFPVTPGAAQTTYTGFRDAYVVKIAAGVESAAAIESSTNPSVFGEQVAFTAKVTPGSANSNTPTGTVTFLDGAATLGTEALLNGTAMFDTGGLSTGSHNITVSYGGDSNFAASTSSILTQVVNHAATTTTLVSSLNPAALGQTVTFTATVAAESPGAGSPTGTVTLKDGATSIESGAVSAGIATTNISTLTGGSHTITASYAGDANFIGSVSGGLSQNVTVPAVTILVNESITVSDAPTLLEQLVAIINVDESITVADGPAIVLPAVINVAESITVTDTPVVVAQPGGPINVSSLVSVTSTGLVYSHITRTFSGTLTVQNTSGQSIAGPIEIVLTNLTSGVTLLNATGTFVGNSYVIVLPSGSLAAGQSASIAVTFGDPSNALIHFTPAVYSGSLN